MDLQEDAVAAANGAAQALAKSGQWYLGRAPGSERDGWLRFAIDNQAAPAGALWTRGRAMGLHDDARSFADLPVAERMPFQVFCDVFLLVSRALEAQAVVAAAVVNAAPSDLDGVPLAMRNAAGAA